MSTLVLHYLTRFSFLQLKGLFFNLDLSDLYTLRQSNKAPGPDPVYQQITSCSCCNWKGKIADSRRQYITFTVISEVELFCPRCNTYMGFVSGDK